MIDTELLKLLVCPVCKGELTHDQDAATLDCPRCRLRYPIRDGIPVMLVEEAKSY